MVLAYLPLLVLQTRSLLDSPHYRAFPMALVGSVVLAWLATRTLGLLEPGGRGVVLPAVGFCGCVLAVAGLTVWPWLGASAAMTTVLTVAYGLGGFRLVRAVLPAWVFASLALLPPTRGDLWLVERLQWLVTRWSSSVLDVLGILHVTEGNVIKIAGHRLLVEQACSGIRSLMVVLGSALLFVLWTRRGVIRSTVLIAAAALWVLLGNVIRVVSVAWAQARWGIDLSHGVRHEVLGFAILLAVLGLTVSTDELLRFFSALWSAHWRESWIVGFNPDMQPSPDDVPPPLPLPPPLPVDVTPPPPTEMPDLGRTWLASWRIGGVFGALALAQWIMLWPLLQDALPGNSVVSGLQVLGKDDLSPRCGPFERQGFEIVDRESSSSFGEFSRTWRYQTPRATALVSIDYPFRGWHELTSCYQGVGWALQKRTAIAGGQSGGTGSLITAEFDRPTGRRASLLFGLDTMGGTPLEPRPARNVLEALRNRFEIFRTPLNQFRQRIGSGYVAMPLCYQVQLLVESDAPLSPADWIEARALFEQVRKDIRRKVARRAEPSAAEAVK